MPTLKLIIADISSTFTANMTDHFSLTEDIEIAATCRSGLDLIETVHKLHPDAVLMDTILEDLDGISALKRLKNEYPDVAYVICTEFSTEAVISRAMKSGAAAFVCKPADRIALHDTVIETVSFMRTSSEYTPGNMPEIDSAISHELAEIGIPGNCEGFRLIFHSVKLILKHPSSTVSMTKQLYPELARTFSTTSSRAERNIRSAIERAYAHGRMHSFSRRPSNRELIMAVAKNVLSTTSII